MRTSKKGKKSVEWPKHHKYETGDQRITLPCGRCIGCKLDRSRDWAIRCVHEKQMHEESVFITLTYNDENLPDQGSLDKKHWQNFMKKLRNRFPNNKIKYFHAGEYGDQFGRPHYHACLFGIDFPDKKLHKETDGVKLYISETLSKIWGKGFSSIGDVTFESAAYVARYILKKITGDRAEKHYHQIDLLTGESIKRSPEYTTMSRNPGIGKTWFAKFGTDAFPKDFLTHNGNKFKPPKYYDKLYEQENPISMEEIKRKRIENIKHEQNTPARLAQRETVKKAQLSQLKRKLK